MSQQLRHTREAAPTVSRQSSRPPANGLQEGTPPTTYDIFVGRQPIFDRQLDVVAYELLFRSSYENQAGELEPYQATAQVLLNTFLVFPFNAIVQY